MTILKPKKRKVVSKSRKRINPLIESLDLILDSELGSRVVVNFPQGKVTGVLYKDKTNREWVVQTKNRDAEIRFFERDIQIIWNEESHKKVYVDLKKHF